MTALDGLGRVADQDVSILNQVQRARGQLKRSLQALEERQATLDEVVDDAAAQRAALAGARAERAGYLAGLEQQKALNDAAIARLTGQARPPSGKAPRRLPAAVAMAPRHRSQRLLRQARPLRGRA